MKFNPLTKSVMARVLILSLFAFATLLMVVYPQAKDKVTPSSKLAKPLIGAWILVGTQDTIGDPSAVGSRLQFFTGKHWAITQADPITGEVIFHHGGSYVLNGDELVKTVEYANNSTAGLIKQSHKFKIKIERDTLTQVGIGNRWNEVWTRAK